MQKAVKNKIVKICDILIEASFYLLIPSVTFSISLVEISATVMISAWIIKKFIDRDISGINTVPVAILGAVFLWTLLSCINSSYFHESFRGIFKVLETAFVFIVISDELNKERHFKLFLYILSFTAFIICLDGIYQHNYGIDLIRGRTLISRDYLRRISASFVHPNSFGIFLFMISGILAAVIFSFRNAVKKRLLLIIPFMLSLYCLFLTRSRGAWLSFAVSVLIIAFLKSRKAVAVVLVLLALWVAFMPGSARNALMEAFDITSGTSRERIQLWEGTVNMIKEHPVLGFGINTYSRNFPDYKPADYSDYRYSHNCYLQMASETGIPGVFLFILFLLSVMGRCRGKIRNMPGGMRKDMAIGIFGSLAGFLFGAIIDTHFYSLVLGIFFYSLLGFCYAQTAGAENPGNIFNNRGER
jgi:putative inorganic carbon (HCO3(-)) transporter